MNERFLSDREKIEDIRHKCNLIYFLNMIIILMLTMTMMISLVGCTTFDESIKLSTQVNHLGEASLSLNYELKEKECTSPPN